MDALKLQRVPSVRERRKPSRRLALSYRLCGEDHTDMHDPEWLSDPAPSDIRAPMLRATTPEEAECWGRAYVAAYNQGVRQRLRAKFLSAVLIPI